MAADIDQPDDDPEALVAAAELTRHTLTQRVTATADELQEIRRATDETDEALAALRNQVGLPRDRPVAEAISEQQTRHKLAEATVARLVKDKKEAAELVAARTRHLERKQTYDAIADDMRAVNFLSFLLEERRQLLIELGSERLRDMTGRYRFSFDSKQSLQVVDELSADAERPVGSLSGGETFLASLALALALADLVAREGGRLECFFLDEGFGSLDPQSFDMAMDGIEHLVAGDRLIGLVSHVEALKARVEDKIVLDKGADGTTLVVDEPAYVVEGSFT
jgi:exonuclease SbcC